MLRSVMRNHCYLCGLLSFEWIVGNNDKAESPTSESFYRRNIDSESGWDRLYLMYSTDEFGSISPELSAAYQAGFTGMFVGACYGGIVNSKVAYTDFMERNEAAVFRSHLEAKKKLQDQVTVAFGKGAFKWGWRLGLFTGTYVLLTTSVSVYRGYSSILEYVTAGCITGALYKLSMGLKGMAVGGGLGGVLGGIAGLASLSILKLSGMSMEEVRYWQYQWKEDRTRRFFKGVKGDENDNALLAHHDKKVGPSGKNLESLESTPSLPTTQSP